MQTTINLSTHRIRHSRHAFTLVEILVVFAIVAILAALTATAVFKVISVQQATNTQLTVKTASSLLDKHWTYVVRQAKDESIPANVMAMADYDSARALVIWTYLRLKQEFPMNISEALYPSATAGGSFLTAIDLPGKKYYYDRIVAAFPHLKNPSFPQLPSSWPPPTTPLNSPPFIKPDRWPLESSFCLTIALQVKRGSNSFDESNFAANALGTDIFILQPPQGRQLIYSGPKCLVDAWDFPLYFYRWPVSNVDFQPSSVPEAQSSPIASSIRDASFPNPLDPTGTLVDARWNKSSNPNVSRFELYCHPISSRFVPYMEPTIVSAGPDHDLGIAPPGSSPFSPDDMRLNPQWPTVKSPISGTYDNVASYKLRLGGSGDK